MRIHKNQSSTDELRVPMYSRTRTVGLAAATGLAILGLLLTLLFFATL